MNKNQVLNTLKLAREVSSKRNFSQVFDIILNLRDINIKKSDENIDVFAILPHSKGKKPKICAFVDKDMTEKAKVFDKVIPKTEFLKYKDPKQIKKIAAEYDFFIAQATIMTDIAKTFGKTLGIKGKMPSPKAGCIITPASNLEQLKQRLEKTIRMKTRNEPIIKAPVGSESLPDEKITENIISSHETLAHAISKEKIKTTFIKLTMGPALRIGETKEEFEKRTQQNPKKIRQELQQNPITQKKLTKQKLGKSKPKENKKQSNSQTSKDKDTNKKESQASPKQTQQKEVKK